MPSPGVTKCDWWGYKPSINKQTYTPSPPPILISLPLPLLLSLAKSLALPLPVARPSSAYSGNSEVPMRRSTIQRSSDLRCAYRHQKQIRREIPEERPQDQSNLHQLRKGLQNMCQSCPGQRQQRSAYASFYKTVII